MIIKLFVLMQNGRYDHKYCPNYHIVELVFITHKIEKKKHLLKASS